MAAPAGELESRLRILRVAAGLTQEELAELAGISARTISDIERGLRTSIYRDTADRLAQALGLMDAERADFEAAARRRTGSELFVTNQVVPDRAPALPPIPLTRLIGRERELLVLTSLLRDRSTRLMTLTGPGGVGKTRLALEAARLVGSDFPDGVFVVELGSVREAEQLLSATVSALDIPAHAAPMFDTLVDRLTGRRSLIVFDTFEHLMPAALLVSKLLGRADGLTVMVTSRERLQLRGEHEFEVPVLAAPPDGAGGPNALSWYPAAVLFVERARAVNPDIEVDEAASTAIADICRRLDGLPLAIELAAARLRHLPLEALRTQLGHGLSVLNRGPRDLPARQQTMRAAVAWSYELLPPSEKALFCQLSVFVGGWSAPSAAAVAAQAVAAATDLIARLIDKSLVRLVMAASPEPRYEMLDVVREFATETLGESSEADDAHSRHADYFVAFAEAAEREFGSIRQWAAFDRVATEHENLRAALRWLVAQADAERALRLCGALWQFWRSHGDYVDGRAWLRRALALPTPVPPAVRAKALWGAAGLAYHNADYADAERRSAELMSLAAETEDPVDLRNAYTIQGVVAMSQQRFGEAVAPLREALRAAQPLGPCWLLATSHLNLGAAFAHSDNLEAARVHLAEARAIYLEIGDANFAARAGMQLGYVALIGGAASAAREQFVASFIRFRELGDPWGAAEGVEAFSVIAAATGDAENSAVLGGAAQRLRETFGAFALPGDRLVIDRYQLAARNSIEKGSWQAAWQRGYKLTPEQAAEIALDSATRKEPV
jgi:predicted ATPase/DNA-binding XRE family transcriptional regulator